MSFPPVLVHDRALLPIATHSHLRNDPVRPFDAMAFIVWGSNTGVGKTLVSAGIARAAAAAQRVLYLKPVQTGLPHDSDGALVAQLSGGVHSFAPHASLAAGLPAPDAAAASSAAHAALVAGRRAPPQLLGRTLFGWREAVSPHLAVRGEGRAVADAALLDAARREVEGFLAGAPPAAPRALVLLETAGGVASPAPSGTLQCDLLAPLQLPAILVADGRLGGISASICAAESLVARGHRIAATVLIDGGLKNEEMLHQGGAPTSVFVLPRLREPHEADDVHLGAERVSRWLDSSQPVWDKLLAHLLDAQRPSEDAVERMIAADAKLLWHPYTDAIAPKRCLPVKSAKGVRLELEDGRQLIDGMSSWWSAVHGYRVPQLDAAAAAQLAKMAHVMFGGLTHAPAVGLAERLVSITPAPLQRVFLCDSGSVSVEVAIKMAFQYWRARGLLGRTKLLTFRGGYHGDTFGAMSVCDPVNGMHSEMFAGALAEHLFAPKPVRRFGQPCDDGDLAAFREMLAAHHAQVAAVILEPVVQGAGGMNMYSADYLVGVRKLCDEFGVLLILDCIATGFGRTGKLFACEHARISPDIMCLGKALTGGYMTLGATVATEEVALGVSGGLGTPHPVPLMHGPTFMANPLACAVACASIDLLLSSPWEERVATIEAQLEKELQPLSASPAVADVRVMGAIGVVEMMESIDMADAQARLIKNGVWLRPFGKLLYTMPPFVTSSTDLSRITSAMREVVEAAESSSGHTMVASN